MGRGGEKGRGVHVIRRRNTYVCVEIEGYSVAYFDRIAVFEALCCWISIMDGAHTCFVDV